MSFNHRKNSASTMGLSPSGSRRKADQHASKNPKPIVRHPYTANIKPTLCFNTHRFLWWLSDFDLYEFMRSERPRRLVSRKFRTRIDQKLNSAQPPPSPAGLAAASVAGGTESATIHNLYWRISLGTCRDEHRHLRLHCSSDVGVDILCIVRVFTKRAEQLSGTLFNFDAVSKMNEMDFQLDRRLVKDLERQGRRKKKTDTLLEVIILSLAEYNDGTKKRITDQMKQVMPADDDAQSPCSTSMDANFVHNAKKSFEYITDPSGPHFSDVTLVVAEESIGSSSDSIGEESPVDSAKVREERFYCHRYILCQASPVFAAMFSGSCGDFVENTNREVRIDDVKPKFLREFLHYIYTGTLQESAVATPIHGVEKPSEDTDDLMKNNLNELIHLAEKYQVEGLKQQCEFRLLGQLNNDRLRLRRSAVEDLVMAHCYNLHRLKALLLRLVAWHADELLTGGTLNSHLDSEECVAAGRRAEMEERKSLLKQHPDLQLELSAYLARVMHHRAEELEDESMSENDSSGASSPTTCSSDNDSDWD